MNSSIYLHPPFTPKPFMHVVQVIYNTIQDCAPCTLAGLHFLKKTLNFGCTEEKGIERFTVPSAF